MSDAKKTRVIEIDQTEMACRIAEAVIGAKRPDGASPNFALVRLGPEMEGVFLKAAAAAIEYVGECTAAAAAPGKMRMISPAEVSSGSGTPQ